MTRKAKISHFLKMSPQPKILDLSLLTLLCNLNFSLSLLHVVAMVTYMIESNQFKYQLIVYNFISNHDRKII